MAQESAIKKQVKKSVQEINDMINDRLKENLETYHIPNIIDVILQDYDIDLSGRVTNRSSRTNPIFYRDEFEEALNNFEWIDSGAEYTKLTVPETDTFNWNQGRLKIIENIVNGTIGLFIEVDETQYIAMYEKRPIITPFDKAVPRRDRIYTLRLTGDVRRRWADTFPQDSWVRYPFSNSAPIDIFDAANLYVQDNMKDWIDETITEVMREVKG